MMSDTHSSSMIQKSTAAPSNPTLSKAERSQQRQLAKQEKARQAREQRIAEAASNRAAVDEATAGDAAASYGNFHNYYNFNPPSERLQYLPDDFASALIGDDVASTPITLNILDVGCNEGDLTIALVEKLTQQYAATEAKQQLRIRCLGVDIDSVLIERAQKLERATMQTPLVSSDIRFECCDVMTTEGRQVVHSFLGNGTQHRSRYDLICAWSVTMWLHLHHGDLGLQQFLAFIASLTSHLLIEPQPWKCYRSAVQRRRKALLSDPPQFHELQWRNDVDQCIVDYLTQRTAHADNALDATPQQSMQLVSKLGDTRWERQVVWLRQQAPS